MESDVASFFDVGKLLKRTAPENLNVFFPRVNLGFGRGTKTGTKTKVPVLRKV